MKSLIVPLVVSSLLLHPSASAAKNLDDLDYRIFPRRTSDEAAVLEWGHSAIISALDASVAKFGPQTLEAALMEVECQPVLASPLTGKKKQDEGEAVVDILDNADEINGNMAVMTNTGGLSGTAMAKIAKKSGAAALLVVNVDEDHPDDIHSMPKEEGEDYSEIDIPIVMISLNSANVLTTATVTPDMHPSEIVNHGMPERVRLYAGGDRPFFEDVEPWDPTLYLIHNLLSDEECNALLESAKSKLEPVEKNDVLQLLPDASKAHNVDRVLLWKGALKTRANKEMDERIEQVTGYGPIELYSDFVVSRFQKGSYWGAHYDAHPVQEIMATVTIFLQDGGPDIVYPSAKGQPVKISPRKGMAVVHQNFDGANEHEHKLDVTAMHAFLPASGETFIAQKHVFYETVSPTRRIVLPMLALPFGGKLPSFIVKVHDLLVEKFGPEQGEFYFNKVGMFVPLLIVLSIAQLIANAVQNQLEKGKKEQTKPETPTAKRDKRKKKGKSE